MPLKKMPFISALRAGFIAAVIEGGLQGAIEKAWSEAKWSRAENGGKDGILESAQQNKGLESLDPDLRKGLAKALENPETLANVRAVTYQDLVNWLASSNPQLFQRCMFTPVTNQWMNHLWREIQMILRDFDKPTKPPPPAPPQPPRSKWEKVPPTGEI